jgi:hypothetical protein
LLQLSQPVASADPLRFSHVRCKPVTCLPGRTLPDRSENPQPVCHAGIGQKIIPPT